MSIRNSMVVWNRNRFVAFRHHHFCRYNAKQWRAIHFLFRRHVRLIAMLYTFIHTGQVFGDFNFVIHFLRSTETVQHNAKSKMGKSISYCALHEHGQWTIDMNEMSVEQGEANASVWHRHTVAPATLHSEFQFQSCHSILFLYEFRRFSSSFSENVIHSFQLELENK